MKLNYKKYTALFFALCTVLLVVSGCMNELVGPSQQQPAAGKGILVLSVSDGTSSGRTIAPDAGLTFDKYDIKVFNKGTTSPAVASVELEGRTHSTMFELRRGEYDINVKGFKVVDAADPSKDILIAEGSKSVTVLNGATSSYTIMLAPSMTGGDGTFAWNLTFDDAIDAALMTIFDSAGEETDFVDVNVKTRNQDSETLEAGEYDVVFKLTFGSQDVEWKERLHVYKDLESKFTYKFEDLRIETIAERIEAVIKGTSSTGINENHFIIAGIHGVTSANVTAVLGAIEWFRDIGTSVDIALITLHNFNHPYHGEDDLKNTINSLVANDTELVISVDTTNLEATVTIKDTAKSITITGFSITDADITSLAVAEGTGVRLYYQYYSNALDFSELEIEATFSHGPPRVVDFDSLIVTYDPISFDPTDPESFNTPGVIQVTLTVDDGDNDPSNDIYDNFAIEIAAFDRLVLGDSGVNKDSYYQYIPATVNLASLVVTGYWKEADETEHHHTLNNAQYTVNGLHSVTGASLTVSDVATADVKPISIVYHDSTKAEGFNVTVHPLAGIKLVGPQNYADAPNTETIKAKVQDGTIAVHGTFDLGNLNTHVQTIPHEHNDFTSAAVTIAPPNVVEGKPQEYTVTFVWNDFTCTEFKWTYNDTTPILDRIEVTGTPGKFYQFITDFNSTGMTVTTRWTHDSSKDADVTTSGNVTFNSESTYDKEVAGSVKIDVEYTPAGGASGTFNGEYYVTVIELEDIIVTGLDNLGSFSSHPEKAAIREKITKVEAVYEDGETAIDITSSISNNNIIIDEDNTTVTVNWNQKTKTFSYSISVPDIKIASATVSITAPVTLATVHTAITIDPSEHYTVSGDTHITWSEKNAVGTVHSFDAEKNYVADFLLLAKEGYTFADIASTSITVAGSSNVSVQTSNVRDLQVTVEFPATTRKVIDGTIEISITAPATGAQPNASVGDDQNTAERYTGGTIEWKDSDGNAVHEDGFEDGKIYVATFTLTATANYKFTEATIITVGNVTVETEVAANGVDLIVTVTFDEPGVVDPGTGDDD